MPEGDDNVRDLLAAGADALAEAGFRTGDFSVAREQLEAAQAEAARGPDLVARARALDLLGMLAHYERPSPPATSTRRSGSSGRR
jgi:hypothetical protein